MANQRYSFLELKTAVTHVLHGAPNAGSPAAQIVNRAVGWLAKRHNWRWRQRPLSLDLPSYAITTLARASNVVTVTRTAHGLVSGVTVNVVGSVATTNAFNGQFVVNTIPTANTFTYAQGGADETAGTPGSYIPGFLPLPADFDEIVTLGSPPRGLRGYHPCEVHEIIERRAGSFSGLLELWFALSYLPQASVTASPTAILEIWPILSAATPNLFQGMYRRIIPIMTTDTDYPDIPDAYHDLLMVLCRAMAKSTEEDQSGQDWDLFNAMLADYIGSDARGAGVIAGTLRSTIRRPTGFGRGRLIHSGLPITHA